MSPRLAAYFSDIEMPTLRILAGASCPSQRPLRPSRVAPAMAPLAQSHARARGVTWRALRGLAAMTRHGSDGHGRRQRLAQGFRATPPGGCPPLSRTESHERQNITRRLTEARRDGSRAGAPRANRQARCRPGRRAPRESSLWRCCCRYLCARGVQGCGGVGRGRLGRGVAGVSPAPGKEACAASRRKRCAATEPLGPDWGAQGSSSSRCCCPCPQGAGAPTLGGMPGAACPPMLLRLSTPIGCHEHAHKHTHTRKQACYP